MKRRDPPSVSILLPAFDAAATLPACLRSIRRQSWRDWECIVVDDGSSDDTWDLVAKTCGRDRRFRLIGLPHGGLVAALNAGLARCRGTYVARMDADDLMPAQRLEEQLTLLEDDPSLSAVGCHVRMFPRSAMGPGYRAYETWLNSIDSATRLEREAFVECPVAHPSLLLRRRRMQEFGYRDRGWPEDYDLILRLLAAGDRVGVLPRRRLCWRLRPGRLSRTDPAYDEERFTSCKAAFLARGFLADTVDYILWGHGKTGRSLRRALAAIGKQASHIIEVHPGRLGNRIHGAPVLPPSALPDLPRRPLIVSVAGPGPRGRIRRALSNLGFREPRDFVCAA